MAELFEADALVIRTKENYYSIIRAKLGEINASGHWLNLPSARLGGQTPSQVIESGHGHIAERLLEEATAALNVHAALNELRRHYRGLPELKMLWEVYDAIRPQLEARIQEVPARSHQPAA
jgi:hypothetical protein